MSRDSLTVRPAGQEDLARIDSLLRCLAVDLGDEYEVRMETLAQAGFGTNPVFRAQLAERREDDTALGIALYSPVFSTILGGAGVYLSDLWVSPVLRGQGLGLTLLTAALADAAEHWQARYMKLAVYDDNTRARAFYTRLGFSDALAGEHQLLLTGAALHSVLNAKVPA